MENNLYDKFSNWFYNVPDRKNAVYIYSDPHFSDKQIYQIRFPDIEINDEKIEELDRMQINNINKVCGKNDTLIILGDIGNLECIKKLRAGYKVLIMGNHDSGASNYKRIRVKEIKEDFELGYNPYDVKNADRFIKEHWKVIKIDEGGNTFERIVSDDRLFDEVYEGPQTINDRLILSHEPLEPLRAYEFNIHGHDHSGSEKSPHHLNICAEHINYIPLNLGCLLKNGLLKGIESIHRFTIDAAIDRKKKRIKKEVKNND